MRRFGFERPNVELRQGYIEDLSAADIADNSVDVVISNCVLNLPPDKEQVFAEIFRVLKPGGELYFADVFADRRPPTADCPTSSGKTRCSMANAWAAPSTSRTSGGCCRRLAAKITR